MPDVTCYIGQIDRAFGMERHAIGLACWRAVIHQRSAVIWPEDDGYMVGLVESADWQVVVTGPFAKLITLEFNPVDATSPSVLSVTLLGASTVQRRMKPR